MRCPLCGNVEDKVIETRTLAEGGAVRRRRECSGCGYRFTSYEKVEDKPFMVIKHDGRREPFDRDKIERGLDRAIRKRPIPMLAIERIANEVVDETYRAGSLARELSSAAIGEIVLEKLSKLDRVAYIRYASVCRRFENLDEFVEEIRKLETVGSEPPTKLARG
ncbi:MAG: transcriptional regulator NrdR [Spirochaetaceae bacterium]|jgi:transcriptional repressor NrdR|nr:transcriptional regulator NrdR [Spirochaetaceae bacterium]